MRSLALAAALCVSGTASVAAASSAAPVSIQECRPTGDREFSKKHELRLIVRLRNESGATLSSVRIAMLVRGLVQTTIEDTENLAPGASTGPWLTVDTGAIPLDGVTTCAVAAVRYADGTTWTNPVLGASAGLHVAQTPGSPIRIEQCFTRQEGHYVNSGGYVWTRFVTTGAVPATRVVFSLLVNGKRVMRFEDQGSFAPGVSVPKETDADGNIFPVDDLHPQCRVDAVHLADATVWVNPEAARLEPYGTYQTPGARIDVLHCAVYLPKDSTTNGIFFGFRNAAAETATEVDFAFWADGKRQETGTFKGTYSTGTKVDFGVALGARSIPLGTTIAECRVTRVIYADGTVWQAPPSPLS